MIVQYPTNFFTDKNKQLVNMRYILEYHYRENIRGIQWDPELYFSPHSRVLFIFSVISRTARMFTNHNLGMVCFSGPPIHVTLENYLQHMPKVHRFLMIASGPIAIYGEDYPLANYDANRG